MVSRSKGFKSQGLNVTNWGALMLKSRVIQVRISKILWDLKNWFQISKMHWDFKRRASGSPKMLWVLKNWLGISNDSVFQLSQWCATSCLFVCIVLCFIACPNCLMVCHHWCSTSSTWSLHILEPFLIFVIFATFCGEIVLLVKTFK